VLNNRQTRRSEKTLQEVEYQAQDQNEDNEVDAGVEGEYI
jgi:hypothetical protein